MIQINRPECPNPTALSNVEGWKDRTNKGALAEASSEKCMYCEAKISHIDYGDIEHIKPKVHYPALECVWTNLGYACPKCNREYKSDNYDEETPFLDPYSEDPEEHMLAFGVFMKQKQGSERGELTITQIGLNRKELIERRKERLDSLEGAINSCFRTANPQLKANALEELKKEATRGKEFSLMAKCLLKSHEII